ncbi:MAG: deoxyribodipyrimidine photo-lyase [Flavobacteriaceae bacterium]|nr:deoxyribodipyrimidine photo-lyase [Flavobacteriaceae bacterium]
MKISIFWYRRDLRLEDNTGLFEALNENENVLPIFIFDDSILDELPEDDARVNFIYESLSKINKQLNNHNASLQILKGQIDDVWEKLVTTYDIQKVYLNKDYEPYAIKRDQKIKEFLNSKGIEMKTFKDQVIFEENEIVKADGKPYTVFTPYKRKWLEKFTKVNLNLIANFDNFYKKIIDFPTLNQLGLKNSPLKVKNYSLKNVSTYSETRNFPNLDSTSYLSPHLRFGTISVRQIITELKNKSEIFLSELIWREFFMQIIFHFPHVVTKNFRPKYDGIKWVNNKEDYDNWCQGKTGYPLVDAGMRQLNETGYMHNRVRMVTAGFLCKHLLIDWRYGEAYFAKKLLDYELSSNNGNWQWAAGTGCDAAPYFRIFNPIEQLKKFDKTLTYTKKWVKDFDTLEYPKPIVDHKYARNRALEAYKKGIN